MGDQMKNKLLRLLILVAFALGTFARAQTDVSPTPTPLAQLVPSPQMQGMDHMSDSMTKMAEMCQTMMAHEKAAMPFIISTSIVFGLLLLIALVLLIVLEVLWIRYWLRILKQTAG